MGKQGDFGYGTKGYGRGGKLPEYRVVNGRETLGQSAPSVVNGHESYRPDSAD